MMQNHLKQDLEMPRVAWKAVPVSEELGRVFTTFKQSAFRLETLQSYAEPSESSPFNQYERGELPDPSFMADWCQLASQHTASGRAIRRVHIVDLPLSNYMKFEIEHCYKHSEAAGEEIRLLERSKLSGEILKFTREDFWLFDGSTVMVNDYDANNTFYQARMSSDPDAVAYYSNIDKKIWDLGTPFKEFYKAQTGLEL